MYLTYYLRNGRENLALRGIQVQVPVCVDQDVERNQDTRQLVQLMTMMITNKMEISISPL